MKKITRLHRALLLLGLFIIAPQLLAKNDDVETEYGLAVGWRQDSLDWNIAADITGTATPNILSELTWDPLNMLQIEAFADHPLRNKWLLIADGRYALTQSSGIGAGRWLLAVELVARAQLRAACRPPDDFRGTRALGTAARRYAGPGEASRA